jgi:hypothetical protein
MKVLLDVDDEGDVQIDVVVQDPVVYELLGRYTVEQMDARLALVADMLEVGARVMQRARDGAQADLLRREVDRMREQVEHAQEMVATGFVEAMRPTLELLGQGLAQLSGQMDGVLATVQAKQEAAAERERGTAKGRAFEEQVAEDIASIARAKGDSAQHVGDVGGIGGRAGDVVVDVGAAEGASLGRIVFEVKTGRLSRNEATRELDQAMEVRDADYAVLVVDDPRRIPAQMHELWEYGGDKVIVAADEDWTRRGVEFAYAIARARIVARRVVTEGVDVDVARAAIDRAIASLDNARSLKLRLTNLSSAAGEARELVDQIVDEVRSRLDAAAQALVESG